MKRVVSPIPASPLPLASVTIATGSSDGQADSMGKNKGADSGTDNAHRFQLFGLGSAAIAVIASLAWMAVFNLVEAKRTVTLRFYVTKMLPVGLFMALTLHFGNLVYLYLTVSFIQMLKAFTPIITMIALFAARLESPTRRLIVSVSFIALGTALASVGEVNLSTTGILIMFLSEAFEAIRLVMTQVLLVGLKFHPIEGLLYLAPACTFWLLLGSACLEFPRMAQSGAFLLMLQRPVKFTVAAAMGFMVNSLAYIVIQTASSLTLKVLGTVKNALVVCLGIAFLQETVTGLQGVGYAISVGAFFWYNQIKMQQMRGSTPLPSSSSSSSGGGTGSTNGGAAPRVRYVVLGPPKGSSEGP
ncbi:hypothetical protein N2152v2_001514 [Parachlorella kessleri]